MVTTAPHRLIRLFALMSLSSGGVFMLLIVLASLLGQRLPSYQLLYADNPGGFILRDFGHHRSLRFDLHPQAIPLEFRWSPDGRQFIYRTIVSFYTYSIYDLFERRLIPLEIEQSPGILPSWSADSQRIVYASIPNGLCVLTLENAQTDCLESSLVRSLPWVLSAEWSPDGQLIAYYGDIPPRLKVIDLQNEAEFIVTDTDGPFALEQLIWSPDSRSLIFRRRSNSISFLNTPRPSTDLYRAALQTAEPGTWDIGTPFNFTSQVVGDSGYALGYRWSPDNEHFAYTATQSTERNAVFDLYIYSRSDNTTRRITHDDSEERDPSWSPDGRWLAYISNLDGYPTLVLRSAADDYALVHTESVNSNNLDWRPSVAWP